MTQFILDRKFLFLLVPYLILYIVAAHNPLIGDTIRFGAEQPGWYYDHNFRYFLLPDYCDSGHPPTFALYLAAAWKLLGKSLWVSHTAMLPFVFMIVFQAVRLGDRIFPNNQKNAFLCALLLLSEAVLVTQTSLVSPDILFLAFFLYTLNAIPARSVMHTVLAATLLGMLSLPAMRVPVGLFLFSLSYNSDQVSKDRKPLLRYCLHQFLPFVPGILVVMAYSSYHYTIKGWVGLNPQGGGDLLANAGLLLWRLVDVGKIGTVLVFAVLLGNWATGYIRFATVTEQKMTRNLLVLFLALLVTLVLPLSLYDGLPIHRYLMLFSISISLLAMYLLSNTGWKVKHGIIFVVVLIQLSGHFWSYPRAYTQAWDGTLAHLPFFALRAEFKQYMADHDIPKTAVATAPSLVQPDYLIDLQGDPAGYKDVQKDDAEYVWYSNVCNTMNKTVDYYFKHWQVVKYEKKGNVEMALFKRK